MYYFHFCSEYQTGVHSHRMLLLFSLQGSRMAHWLSNQKEISFSHLYLGTALFMLVQASVVRTGAESIHSWPHVSQLKSSTYAAATKSSDAWSGIRKQLRLRWLWCLALEEQFFPKVMGQGQGWAKIKDFLPPAVPARTLTEPDPALQIPYSYVAWYSHLVSGNVSVFLALDVTCSWSLWLKKKKNLFYYQFPY